MSRNNTAFIENKELVYKAQWPLGGNMNTVLIYPDKTREPWIQMPCTEILFKTLFAGKYCKVYFRGIYKEGEINVVKFVRHKEWI